MQELDSSSSTLLTVAIPTFKRSQCLSVLLTSILQQWSDRFTGRIEVLILDNSSPDDTPEVVQPFLAQCSGLRYMRNETNIGADNNFVKAFWEAKGEYLWVLGDDELLFDGALEWVFQCCLRETFGAAYLYSVPDILERVHGLLGRRVPGDVSVKEFAPWAFVRAANYRLTFLSGSVINRRAVIRENPNISAEIESFSGSNLVHLTWILSAARACDRSLIVTTPLFASTVANSGGYSPVKVFVINLSRLVGFYFSQDNPKATVFMQRFTLIGWFPKVVYDCRFSEKYRRTGYRIEASEFPDELRSGPLWFLFERGVLNGLRPVSWLAMFMLKLGHRCLQALFLRMAK